MFQSRKMSDLLGDCRWPRFSRRAVWSIPNHALYFEWYRNAGTAQGMECSREAVVATSASGSFKPNQRCLLPEHAFWVSAPTDGNEISPSVLQTLEDCCRLLHHSRVPRQPTQYATTERKQSGKELGWCPDQVRGRVLKHEAAAATLRTGPVGVSLGGYRRRTLSIEATTSTRGKSFVALSAVAVYTAVPTESDRTVASESVD